MPAKRPESQRRIVVTPPILLSKAHLFEPLSALGFCVVFNEGPYPMSATELTTFVADATAAVVGLDELNATVFETCRHLRAVARNGVGLDQVDLEAATRHGVLVTAPVGANSTAVAELTLGLLIALQRHVIPAHSLLKKHTWQRRVGTELAEKTLGIIGLGRIGKKVAVRARAFDMRVVAHDICPDEVFADVNWIEIVPLNFLLQNADVVSLHLPLTPETFHLMNQHTFERMKRDAVLVNTARGEIVDAVALANALRDGVVAGAALDVHQTETSAHPLLLHQENVVLTPHLGAYTNESLERTTIGAVESLVQIFEGRKPTDLINAEAWPPYTKVT